MFRILIYPSSGACDYSVELPHWWYCSWFDVCWSFSVGGQEWYPCFRLWLGWSGIRVQAEASACNTDTTPTKPQPATRIPLQFKHSLHHGYHSNSNTACNTGTTPTQPHRNSNTHRTKNNTTNVIIQQNSRKLLMMDILMSETC